ncbi:EH domain-containing protein 1-like [Arachis duranensis]|uniref:EH domain-containing protein 1-like n=1 Tax=Arachis duranensis TaxID=130453 RepID=A0A9C6TU24_ARADU|nr:EH domain-containing protein 1-like [Arachis duranensis]
MDLAIVPFDSFPKDQQMLYQEWFNYADSDGDGRFTGSDATKFFAMSNLSRQDLRQVWAIADTKRQGYLDFQEFVIAMQIPASAVTSIIDGLKKLYIQKLRPLEATYRFNDFVSPLLAGPDERSIPGNTIAVHADMPFSGLSSFGSAFLSKFECSQMPHPLLEEITFVDSPGVLSGEKQRTQRAYDFTGVTSWFAAKCDLILLLFDPHKLDVSDEFKRVISSLRGHDDKIRVVLNKAHQVDTQQLMRIYGALMWSLGKVLNTPEVMRVYIGYHHVFYLIYLSTAPEFSPIHLYLYSYRKYLIIKNLIYFCSSFNDKPIDYADNGPLGGELFEKEQDDLLLDLKDIPRKACDRKINEFVKRARAAKIHAYIISHLKKQMPSIMGKTKAQEKLIANLEGEFAKVQREFHLPPGDFPNVEEFREKLRGYNIDKFERLRPKLIDAVDDMLGYDIPNLLKTFRNPYG